MSSLLNWLKSLSELYREAIVSASKALVKNWIIAPATLAMYILIFVLSGFLAPLQFAGGLILGLLQIVLLSFFYSYLSRAVDGEKLEFKDLLEFDFELLNGVASVAFIYFLIIMLTNFQPHDGGNFSLSMIVQLGFVFIFNSIPEVIYIKRLQSIEALSFSWGFTRDNWIEWYLPLVICILPWFVASPYSLLVAFSTSEPLLPTLFIIDSVSRSFTGANLVGMILALIISIWFMLLRGFIFKSLDSGAWRRRR